MPDHASERPIPTITRSQLMAAGPGGSGQSRCGGAGRRFACQAASQALKGQKQADQKQLCMAQARLDCLKQAIDQ